MNNDTTLQNVKEVMGIPQNDFPQRPVKIEKKERGLYERAKESTIILTEDNKMILND